MGSVVKNLRRTSTSPFLPVAASLSQDAPPLPCFNAGSSVLSLLCDDVSPLTSKGSQQRDRSRCPWFCSVLVSLGTGLPDFTLPHRFLNPSVTSAMVWPLTLGSVRRHQSILAWWYAWKIEMKPRGRVGKPTNVSPNIKLPRWAHLEGSLCLNTSTVVVSRWPKVKATCILTELCNYGVLLLNISKHRTSTSWHVCDRCRNWRTETWSDFWGDEQTRVHF